MTWIECVNCGHNMMLAVQHINDWAKEAWDITDSKGFHTGRSILEKIALVMSELGEGVDAVRDSPKPLYYHDYSSKPEGVSVELVDTIIRIMDMFVTEKWDLEEILRLKLEYNKTRSYKHGGKRY